jgi:hypothetical protein
MAWMCVWRWRVLDGPDSRFALPYCWVCLNSPRWRSRRVIWAIVHLVDLRERNLTSPILKALENLFGGDFTGGVEDIRVVKECENVIRYLRPV